MNRLSSRACVVLGCILSVVSLTRAAPPSSAKSTTQSDSASPADLYANREAIRSLLATPDSFPADQKNPDTAAAPDPDDPGIFTTRGRVERTSGNSVGPAQREPLSDGVLALNPFIVTAPAMPSEQPRETQVEKFIRTGTIWQHVGKKVTTRFWMKGDEGLMLRFSW